MTILNLARVKLTKAEETAAAELTANSEVLAKSLTTKTKDELVKALAYEVTGKKRLAIAQRIGSRIGVLVRAEIDQEIIEALRSEKA